jgi:hypothetical protein
MKLKKMLKQPLRMKKKNWKILILKIKRNPMRQQFFDADLNNPQERENILKPLDNFGMADMYKISITQRNVIYKTKRFD